MSAGRCLSRGTLLICMLLLAAPVQAGDGEEVDEPAGEESEDEGSGDEDAGSPEPRTDESSPEDAPAAAAPVAEPSAEEASAEEPPAAAASAAEPSAAAAPAAEPPAAAAPAAEPSGKPRVGFRADFRTGWNLTDGTGVLDHAGLGVSLGPQIGRACRGCRPSLGPFFGATVGIAEEGRPSLRLVLGLEIGLGLAPDVELVPSFFGGFFKAFEDDERQGPVGGASLALRVRGPNHFFFSVEPVRLVVLPPPPAGFTRYTSHVALDMGIVRFGGITP